MIGHVDHGKTSLTSQLTGKWTDTHSEELKRGISIRLGYADVVFRKCPSCPGDQAYTVKAKCENCGKPADVLRKVSFVDVPGHETLMATMLSGAALMDGAILVIAANEACPQPQTEEHLMVLKITGKRNLVVAQNKIDLVSREQAIQNRREIEDFLKSYGFENVPIIPIAATAGINIDLLIKAIHENIPTPKRPEGKKLRMMVARSFDVNKPGASIEKMTGAVLGGSIIEGEIRIGDEIEISPGLNGKIVYTKANSLSTDAGLIEKAGPGGLIATATLLDPSLGANDSLRGQTIGHTNELPKPVMQLRLEYHELKRLIMEKQIKVLPSEPVVLAVGANTVIGTVKRVNPNHIEIDLKQPAVVFPDEIIAISKRDQGKWHLAAYGVVK